MSLIFSLRGLQLWYIQMNKWIKQGILWKWKWRFGEFWGGRRKSREGEGSELGRAAELAEIQLDIRVSEECGISRILCACRQVKGSVEICTNGVGKCNNAERSTRSSNSRACVAFNELLNTPAMWNTIEVLTLPFPHVNQFHKRSYGTEFLLFCILNKTLWDVDEMEIRILESLPLCEPALL